MAHPTGESANVEDKRLEDAVIEEPEEVPTSSWVLVGQFFVIPVIIVALCVGIFLLFGLITGDPRTARDYLEEVKAGGRNRWQAAFELSKHITAQQSGEADRQLAKEISSAFRNAGDDDPRIQQYLALALGNLKDPVAVEPLIEALERQDPDVRLYSVWALGEIRDARALEPLLEMIESNDPSLRKMTAFSLGRLGDARAVPALKPALQDVHPDVRWNAALALARLQDRSGITVLHGMLDRRHLDSLTEIREEQKSEAIINAIHGVVLLKDGDSRSLLEALSRNDRDLRVRSAALQALEEIP